MSLFQSKVFWVCAAIFIGIAGFLGFNTYKSKALPPVIIYKASQPSPIVKSPEKTQEDREAADQAGPPVETIDSFETDPPSVETFEADVPISTPDDSYEDLTVEESQITDKNDETANGEADSDFDAGDFSAELQKQFMSVMSRYPLLSMSESEIFELLQTREGLLEVKRQAEEIQVEMRRLGHEYIPKLSDEQKQQAKEETRRMLSEHLSPAEIESYISQFPW